MNERPRKTVSVFGGYHTADDGYEQALAVGRALAEAGLAVANGGYAGTMEASARGAREAGGHTIGVTCDIWDRPPNQWIVEEVRTKEYAERLETLIALGSGGYVALPGATGTLVELAMVWERSLKRFWPEGKVRPIVCMGAFWQPLVDMMSAQRKEAADAVRVIEDPAELGDVFRTQS